MWFELGILFTHLCHILHRIACVSTASKLPVDFWNWMPRGTSLAAPIPPLSREGVVINIWQRTLSSIRFAKWDHYFNRYSSIVWFVKTYILSEIILMKKYFEEILLVLMNVCYFTAQHWQLMPFGGVNMLKVLKLYQYMNTHDGLWLYSLPFSLHAGANLIHYLWPAFYSVFKGVAHLLKLVYRRN